MLNLKRAGEGQGIGSVLGKVTTEPELSFVDLFIFIPGIEMPLNIQNLQAAYINLFNENIYAKNQIHQIS